MMVVFFVFTLEYIWLFQSTDTTLVLELNTTCSQSTKKFIDKKMY